MTVALRSLRVTADMDSAGYARGAQQKVAADASMIASGDRFGASLATTDMALQKLPAGMARLSRMWLGGYSEAEKFEKAVRQVGNAIDHGMDLDRAVTMLKAIETQFGRTANAAQLAKQGFVSVVSPLSTAHVDQTALNSRLGIGGGSGKSAADSAAIFQQAAAEQESMAASAKALRAEIDPLGTAQARLNAELLEYRALANAGVISTQELTAAQDLAQHKFSLLAHNIEATGQHTRLARHEMANLSYQLNDVAVMLASGQAPFMLFMQQGMQIGQLLGPKGLLSAVKLLGGGILSFLTNPVNLAVVAFAALAAGAGAAIKLLKSDLPTVEELLKRQKTLLDELKESYSDLGLEVGKLHSQSVNVIRFQVGLNVEDSNKRIQTDLNAILKGIEPKWNAAGRAGGIQSNPQYNPFSGPIKEVLADLKSGNGDVEKFRKEIEEIARGTSDEKLKKTAKSVLDLTDEIESFQRQTDQLSLSLDPLASKLSQLFAMKPQDLIGKEPGYADIQSFIPDTRNQLEKLNETHKAFERRSSEPQFFQFAAQEAVKYQQALDALNQELAKTAHLNDLEIQSIYAKSPAQKAAIAAERERVNAINTGIKGEELNIRVQHAAAQAYQEATFAIREQNKARLAAANDNISNAQIELKLVGASAAAQSELRANLAAYIDLKKQAEAHGLAFDEAQYDLLKKKNAEVARYIELTARQKLATELDTERGYSGMTSRESDIQKRLLSSGIEEGTQAWRDFHDEILGAMEAQDSFMAGAKSGFDEIRANANNFAASTKEVVTQLYGGMEDALVEFVKLGKVNWQTLIDQMIDDVIRLSYKMAMSGILNMLIGGSAGNTSGYGGIFGSLFKSPSLYSAKGDIFSSPTAYAYSGGVGVMGEAGPEAVVPLSRGKDGKLGISGGGSNVTILPTVYNTSDKVTARSEVKDHGNGRFELVTVVEDIVIETLAGHKGQSAMSALYGIGRQRRTR